jgi:hypothetical protein
VPSSSGGSGGNASYAGGGGERPPITFVQMPLPGAATGTADSRASQGGPASPSNSATGVYASTSPHQRSGGGGGGGGGTAGGAAGGARPPSEGDPLADLVAFASGPPPRSAASNPAGTRSSIATEALAAAGSAGGGSSLLDLHGDDGGGSVARVDTGESHALLMLAPGPARAGGGGGSGAPGVGTGGEAQPQQGQGQASSLFIRRPGGAGGEAGTRPGTAGAPEGGPGTPGTRRGVQLDGGISIIGSGAYGGGGGASRSRSGSGAGGSLVPSKAAYGGGGEGGAFTVAELPFHPAQQQQLQQAQQGGATQEGQRQGPSRRASAGSTMSQQPLLASPLQGAPAAPGAAGGRGSGFGAAPMAGLGTPNPAAPSAASVPRKSALKGGSAAGPAGASGYPGPGGFGGRGGVSATGDRMSTHSAALGDDAHSDSHSLVHVGSGTQPQHAQIHTQSHQLERGSGGHGERSGAASATGDGNRSTGEGRGGGGGGDETRSAGSRGTTTSRQMGRLRRTLQDITHQPLLKGLLYLKWVGAGITLLAIALAITLGVVITRNFQTFAGNIEYSTDAATRLRITFNAMLGLQDLVWAAKGWQPFANPGREAAVRAEILGNVSDFAALHRSLYSYMQASGAGAVSGAVLRALWALWGGGAGGAGRGTQVRGRRCARGGAH